MTQYDLHEIAIESGFARVSTRRANSDHGRNAARLASVRGSRAAAQGHPFPEIALPFFRFSLSALSSGRVLALPARSPSMISPKAPFIATIEGSRANRGVIARSTCTWDWAAIARRSRTRAGLQTARTAKALALRTVVGSATARPKESKDGCNVTFVEIHGGHLFPARNWPGNAAEPPAKPPKSALSVRSAVSEFVWQ
jgi:hypothetical protein